MAVSNWARRLRSGGLRRLHHRKPSGRPSRLSPRHQKELKRLLKRGALAAGFDTDRWTLQRVRRLIKREFGVTYHPNCLNRLLRRLDFSPQQPLPRAAERDDELVKAWLARDWPRIKKARRNGATIVFFDEFSFSFVESLGHTWAPTGKRPVLRRVTCNRRVLSTAMGLSLSGRIYKRHFNDTDVLLRAIVRPSILVNLAGKVHILP